MFYEIVIGLEVHAQLLTRTKIFCSCSTRFGAPPNTQVCPVCLGMPGVLPVLNRRALEYGVKTALAVGGKIAQKSRFARKNYFYPDLPKGYQISQYDRAGEPLARGGQIEIETANGPKSIRLRRIHMEEEAGKSIHDEPGYDPKDSYIDFNRTGVPLLEIVSEPDINSPQEAYAYLMRLKQILEYLEVCDCNMEEGSLRCDANVSVRPAGTALTSEMTEVKNMNSFHGVERALTYEVERQKAILQAGGRIVRQTLGWDENARQTFPMRTKEAAHDYRYFPEPDLVDSVVDQHWIEAIRATLPELPLQRERRFVAQFGLSSYDAQLLTASRQLADYYEATVKQHNDPKMASNWIMSEVLRVLKEDKIEITTFRVTPEQLGELFDLIKGGTISGRIAKDVFDEMAKTGKPARQIVEQKGLVQISDTDTLTGVINGVLEAHAKERADYHKGKKQLFGFFMGQIMKATKGKANPKVASGLLRRKLEEQEP